MSAPGWYPNPAGHGGLRYFDGDDWTEHETPLMADAERAKHLAQTVTIEASRGARIESHTAFSAVVVFPAQQPNHALHFVLCLLTCWMWALVWMAVSGGKPERRFLIRIDEYGLVTRTRVFASYG